MQTFEAASENSLLAYVAGGGVPHSMFRRNSELWAGQIRIETSRKSYHDIMRIGYLDKDVVGVLLRSDPKQTLNTRL